MGASESRIDLAAFVPISAGTDGGSKGISSRHRELRTRLGFSGLGPSPYTCCGLISSRPV